MFVEYKINYETSVIKLNYDYKSYLALTSILLLIILQPSPMELLIKTTIHSMQAEIILYIKISIHERYLYSFQEK